MFERCCILFSSSQSSRGQYPEVSVQGLGCSKHPAGVSVQELSCTRGQSVVRAQRSASGLEINTHGSLKGGVGNFIVLN